MQTNLWLKEKISWEKPNKKLWCLRNHKHLQKIIHTFAQPLNTIDNNLDYLQADQKFTDDHVLY